MSQMEEGPSRLHPSTQDTVDASETRTNLPARWLQVCLDSLGAWREVSVGIILALGILQIKGQP